MKKFIYKLKFIDRYKNKFDSKIKFIWFGILCFFFLFIQTTVFSTLNINLNLAGDAYVRVDENIRISGINLVSTLNSGVEYYSSSYSKDTVKTGVKLNNLNSIINYSFIVSNFSDKDMQISNIISSVDNNSNIIYTMDYNIGDEISAGEVKEINMTIKYLDGISLPSNVLDEMTLTFEFDECGLPMLAEGDTWYKGNTSKTEISSISLHDTYSVPSDLTVTESWDASALENERVTAYVLSDNSLHVVGDGSGKIYANPNSSFAFSDKIVEGSDIIYPFKNVSTINGFDIFDSSYATNMEGMFMSLGNTATVAMDYTFTSYLNTSNVTNMSQMFLSSGENNDFDISFNMLNWDMHNVTDTSRMFYKFGRDAKTLTINAFNNTFDHGIDVHEMFGHAGRECSAKVTGLESWNTSNVVNMKGMFSNFGYFSGAVWGIDDLTGWDTSSVTDMSYMFQNTFNLIKDYSLGDLSNWNVSNVENMAFMFANAGQICESWFVGTLANWDVSKVTDMESMFDWCAIFSDDVKLDLTNWNTKSVTNFSNMFLRFGANSANGVIGDLSNWNTSSAIKMDSMFRLLFNSKESFNIGNLETKTVTSNGETYVAWDVSNVTDMSMMFYCVGQHSTSWSVGDLGTWDVGNVVDFSNCFFDCGSGTLNWSIGDLSRWNVSNVKDFSYMFQGTAEKTKVFDLGNLDNWRPSSVEDFHGMFCDAGYNATTWNIGQLTNWKTPNLKYIQSMFIDAGYNANTWDIGNLNGWDVSKVTSFESLFENAGYMATTWSVGNLNDWNVSSSTTFYKMFNNAGYSDTTWSIGDLSKWRPSSAKNMREMFFNAGYNSETWNIGDISGWTVSKVTNFYSMFCQAGFLSTTWYVGDLKEWDTSSAVYMGQMFYKAGTRASNITLDVSNWNTSNVTNMTALFSSLGYEGSDNSIGDLSNWDTSKVTSMIAMFQLLGYNNTSIDIGNLNNWNTSNVTEFGLMFNYFGGMASSFNIGDVSTKTVTVNGNTYTAWDTGKAVEIAMVFSGCGFYSTGWDVGDISTWNTANVTNFWGALQGYGGADSTKNTLTLNWNTAKATEMNEMFSMNRYLQVLDISSFNTSKVTNMEAMFSTMLSINSIYVGSGWSTSAVTNSTNMFYSSTRLPNYNVSYVDKTYAHYNSGGYLKYK